MDGKAIGQFIPLILIFVIFYFLLIRPQQKRIKEHKAMVEALARGDNVVTAGGIVGKVARIIDGDKAEIQISDNVTIQVIKSTISQVLSKTKSIQKAKQDVSTCNARSSRSVFSDPLHEISSLEWCCEMSSTPI